MDKKQFSLAGVEGVIFDMDGTMVDNHEFHTKAWIEFAKKYGLELTEEEWKQKSSGKRNSQLIPMLLGREVTEQELKDLANEKEEVYREIYAPHLKPIPGLFETLTELKKRKIHLAVATSAPRANRDFVLQALGIEDWFETLVGEEDFTHGKPDPESYLIAAERIHVAPEKCLVFDDAPISVDAAKSGHMKIIGVTTTHPAEKFPDADETIHTYLELSFTD